jgi:perosamine synthetase
MRIYRWAEPNLGIEEREAVEKVIDSTWIGGNGPLVKEFEKELCNRIGCQYAIAVNNGTSALLTALIALKEEYGVLKVAVPTFTFIATATTAKLLANKMVFIDPDKKTWNMPLDQSSDDFNIIMPVDVGGLPCDYHSIQDPLLVVLEDAAEAMGAEYQDRKIGNVSDITIFSFHSAKVMTTGEGGAITTNRKEFYEAMKPIVNQGYGKKEHPWDYEHPTFGLNFRMPELQASLGLVQLKKLEIFLRHRDLLAKAYREELSPYGEFQEVSTEVRHSNFLFGILVDPKKRDKLCEELVKRGVEVKVTWKPCHMQGAFSSFSDRSLPNSEYLYRRIISLPIHNNLTLEDIKEIIRRFKESWKET